VITSVSAAGRPQRVSQEDFLADYARRLQHHLPGRRAVHLHLSRLSAANRREHHLRIAVSAWEGLIKKFDGQLFQLGNNDIVVVTKGAAVAEIDNVVLKLRFLFSEDPLADSSGESGNQTFCTWYELARDYPRFVAMAQDMLARKKPAMPRTSRAAPRLTSRKTCLSTSRRSSRSTRRASPGSSRGSARWT
jgi:hypothetical protein